MKIGIIGGGATGLAAGYRLSKNGHRVEIFERASFLGGQASTFEVGGVRLEKGYHHLFMSDHHMVDLITELGLGDRLRWINSKVGLYHGGRIWKFATPVDLLNFKPLSLLDRIRLGFVTLYLQKVKDWRKLEEITAKEWMEKYVGKNAYQVVWEPLLRGKFGEFYDQVSMAWLWNKLHLRVSSRSKPWSKEKLGYPIGSFGEVFDELGKHLIKKGSEVNISTGVRKILVENDRATGLDLELPGEYLETRNYDAIIATTPSYILSRLVPPLRFDYQEKLINVNYLSAVLLILVLDRPLTQMYWLNIADRTIPFVGIIEQTNFIESSHYGGRHLIYLTNYPSKENPIYKKTGEELLAEYVPHLRKINSKFDSSWIQKYYHHKVDAAQPVIGVNYGQRIPDFRTPIRGLYLANTTQIYPEDRGTNYSIRLGTQVADLLMADFT